MDSESLRHACNKSYQLEHQQGTAVTVIVTATVTARTELNLTSTSTVMNGVGAVYTRTESGTPDHSLLIRS